MPDGRTYVFRPLDQQSSPLAQRSSKRPHCHQTPDSASDQDSDSSASDSEWVDDAVDVSAPDSPLAQQQQPKKVTSRKRKKRARVAGQPTQINSQAEDPILAAEIHLARLSWLNAALTLETSQ